MRRPEPAASGDGEVLLGPGSSAQLIIPDPSREDFGDLPDHVVEVYCCIVLRAQDALANGDPSRPIKLSEIMKATHLHEQSVMGAVEKLCERGFLGVRAHSDSGSGS